MVRVAVQPTGEEAATPASDTAATACRHSLDPPYREAAASALLQGLVGRVRVALDGLNATLGGSMAALRLHIDAVEARFGKGGAPIDFKLAPSDGGIQNAAATQQSVSPMLCTCRSGALLYAMLLLLPRSTFTALAMTLPPAPPSLAAIACRDSTGCRCRPARKWLAWEWWTGKHPAAAACPMPRAAVRA